MNKCAITVLRKLRHFQLGEEEIKLRERSEREKQARDLFLFRDQNLRDAYHSNRELWKSGDGMRRDLSIGGAAGETEIARRQLKFRSRERLEQLDHTLRAKQKVDLCDRLLHHHAEWEDHERDREERREMDDIAQSQFHHLQERMA